MILTDTERIAHVVVILAGWNANQEQCLRDDAELVDLAFDQLAMVEARVERERDARWAASPIPMQPFATSAVGA